MNLLKSIAGMMDVELTSPQQESALNSILSLGIEITDIRYINELVCVFCIRRRDYPVVFALCRKRGDSLTVTKKIGIYWITATGFRRNALLLGITILLCIVFYLPTRILFIHVEGNDTVPQNKILEAADMCGITFGVSRKSVRSEKLKNALLSAIPELQWAGINTSGCVATISVRERTQTPDENTGRKVSNIIAVRDGYIVTGTVTNGNGLFKIGQTVKAGEVLISGYTDCGRYIQASRAEGEITAQTTRELDVLSPANYAKKGKKQEYRYNVGLLIRKKRINLWKDSGISDSSCGRMYEEYYLTLPGGFDLPIALFVDTYLYTETQSEPADPQEATLALKCYAQEYLSQDMVAGVIQEKNEILCEENGVFRLHGCYICTEVISREQSEKIGDTNGESD